MLVYKPAIIQAIGTRWGEKEHIERWLPWLQHREKVERTRILGFETVDPDSALLYAAELGKIDEVRNALARGANIDVLGYNGLTPLMVAVNYSRLEAARILVESGADKTATSPTGTTILSIIHDKVIGGSERKATMLRLLGYTKEADEITNQYRVHNSSSRPYKPE